MTQTIDRSSSTWLRLMPGAFVFLWSTGFIGAKYGLPYAEPLTFLLYRFVIVIFILAAISFFSKAPWPREPKRILHCCISGILLHGVYLGGVFWSIGLGMPAGITALIVGIQPLLTAMLSGPILGEKVSVRQWIALMLGVLGVGLVLAPRFIAGSVENVTVANIFFSFSALFGITLGTIYQKMFVSGEDIRTSGVFQYLGAAILVGAGAFLFETMSVQWTIQFVGALSWLIVVLSLGAISLLILIIQYGAVSRVATMFYLVPPVTSLIAFFVFKERLTGIQLAGMVITAFAVWLASRVR